MSLKEHAYLIVDKDTLTARGHVHESTRQAKTRYSYGKPKHLQFPQQDQDILIKLINPVKLSRLLNIYIESAETERDKDLFRELQGLIDQE